MSCLPHSGSELLKPNNVVRNAQKRLRLDDSGIRVKPRIATEMTSSDIIGDFSPLLIDRLKCDTFWVGAILRVIFES